MAPRRAGISPPPQARPRGEAARAGSRRTRGPAGWQGDREARRDADRPEKTDRADDANRDSWPTSTDLPGGGEPRSGPHAHSGGKGADALHFHRVAGRYSRAAVRSKRGLPHSPRWNIVCCSRRGSASTVGPRCTLLPQSNALNRSSRRQGRAEATVNPGRGPGPSLVHYTSQREEAPCETRTGVSGGARRAPVNSDGGRVRTPRRLKSPRSGDTHANDHATPAGRPGQHQEAHPGARNGAQPSGTRQERRALADPSSVKPHLQRARETGTHPDQEQEVPRDPRARRRAAAATARGGGRGNTDRLRRAHRRAGASRHRRAVPAASRLPADRAGGQHEPDRPGRRGRRRRPQDVGGHAAGTSSSPAWATRSR